MPKLEKRMKLNLILFLVMILSGMVFFLYSSEEQPASPQGLHQYLPEDSEIGEWKKDDSPQEYKGEDLFLYINGGAEIYHEYGFSQVIIQDYINQDRKSISLEIFEMSTADSAYGIYTFKTNPEEKELTLGNQGQLADYYLNFWEGNFLVTITGFDEDLETVKGLQVIARAVDEKIESKGEKPLLTTLLPRKGLKKQSVKYFKGNLGLYNSYQFFSEDVFALQEGIKGEYKDEYTVFIIEYKDSNECQERFNKTKESFRDSSRYKNYTSIAEPLFQVDDTRKDQLVFVSAFKNYLLIIAGTTSQAQTEEILIDIKRNL